MKGISAVQIEQQEEDRTIFDDDEESIQMTMRMLYPPHIIDNTTLLVCTNINSIVPKNKNDDADADYDITTTTTTASSTTTTSTITTTKDDGGGDGNDIETLLLGSLLDLDDYS